MIRISTITYPPEENPPGTPFQMEVNNICNIVISKNEWLLNPNKIYWIADETLVMNYIFFTIKENKLKILKYDHSSNLYWKILIEQLL